MRKPLAGLMLLLLPCALAALVVIALRKEPVADVKKEARLLDFDQIYSERNFTSCTYVSAPQPNFLLPEHISAAQGERTCHADFANAKNGMIRIYLVNRTSSPSLVGTVGRSPEFKAYRELSDGTWELVQPRITMVECGDSVRSVSIPPGMFVSFDAKFHPPSGNPGTIRYQNRSGWISNSGPGFWDEKERDIANSPQQINPLLLFGDEGRPFAGFDQGKVLRSTVERSLARLELQMIFASSRSCHLLCEGLLKSSEQYPDAWREEARKRLVSLQQMKGGGDKAGFVSRCLDYLGRDASQAEFGSPARHPDLCWHALAGFSLSPDHAEDAPWDDVFTVMRSRFPKAGDPELDGMARLLKNELLVHEKLESSFLHQGLESHQREFQAQCVRLLLQRGEESEIIRIAESLDADRRFAITSVLATREAIGHRYGPINEFLLRRAKENPERTLEAIYVGCRHNTDIYLEPGLSIALRPYMEKIVSKGLEQEWKIRDSRERDLMVRILQIGYRDRPPMLKKLAHSKAYYEQRFTSSSEGERVEKEYFMASYARRALAAMGITP